MAGTGRNTGIAPQFRADPQARATAAGYPAPVVENLTAGNFARSGIRSTDGLMTALYHRLVLPDYDTEYTAEFHYTQGVKNRLSIYSTTINKT